MKVVQRINEILKDKNLNKRELARRLIDLGMRASKTGETPTESSIYAYLNGNIEIKADMLPYIAEALGICEQEFFVNSANEVNKILKRVYCKNELSYKYKNIIELLEFLSPKSLELLEKILTQNKAKIEELNSVLSRINS